VKLHTQHQAPKEEQTEEKKHRESYTPTHADYLEFLVDSQHICKAMGNVMNEQGKLAVFHSTDLERVAPLETYIGFMVNKYNLEWPKLGKPRLEYAAEMRRFGKEGVIPEFLCATCTTTSTLHTLLVGKWLVVDKWEHFSLTRKLYNSTRYAH
jgi:hypothetical protein